MVLKNIRSYNNVYDRDVNTLAIIICKYAINFQVATVHCRYSKLETRLARMYNVYLPIVYILQVYAIPMCVIHMF